MSVTFFVSKDRPGVEMSNATARVVLRLLGEPAEDYLEGSLPLDEAKRKLDVLGEEQLAAAVVPPRQIAPGWTDNGTPREWLDSRIEGLRALVARGEREGARRLRWK